MALKFTDAKYKQSRHSNQARSQKRPSLRRYEIVSQLPLILHVPCIDCHSTPYRPLKKTWMWRLTCIPGFFDLRLFRQR